MVIDIAIDRRVEVIVVMSRAVVKKKVGEIRKRKTT